MIFIIPDHEIGNPIDGGATTASPGPADFVFSFNLNAFKLLLIKWIVFCHIAFIQIENKYFRNLIFFLNSGLATFLPSRNTFRSWVLTEFKRRKEKLRKKLKKARSNIHLSFDLWTSPNFYAIIRSFY